MDILDTFIEERNCKLTWAERDRYSFIYDNIPKNSKNILDLGCSEGYLHQFLKFACKPGTLKGVDFGGYDYGLQYNKADVTHDLNKFPYPFKKDSFDCIIAGEIIEHLTNPTEFLEELWRMLKKGGVLIITTPNASGIHCALENAEKADYETPYGHISLFYEVSLRRLLAYCKFTFVKTRYTSYRKYLPFFIINKRFGQNLLVVAKK